MRLLFHTSLFVFVVSLLLCMRVLRVSARVQTKRAFLSHAPYKSHNCTIHSPISRNATSSRIHERAATAALDRSICRDGQGDDASGTLAAIAIICTSCIPIPVFCTSRRCPICHYPTCSSIPLTFPFQSSPITSAALFPNERPELIESRSSTLDA